MMFRWCEIDLALGCARDMPPLQGLGFLSDRLPRALPWAITLCPFGAEDRCPLGAEDRCPVGAEDRCVGVICFNPNGVKGESPGQRPGFAYELDTQALKGRYEGARGMR